MIRDVVITRALRKGQEAFKTAKIYNERLTRECDWFEGLSDKEQLEIVEILADSQFQYAAHQIENKQPAVIPIIGSFKIKENKLVILDFKDTIAREYGFEDYRVATIKIKDLINRSIDSATLNTDEERGIRERMIKIFKDRKKNKKKPIPINNFKVLKHE